MSEQPTKKTTTRIRVEPSAEFDKMLSQLVGSESVKQVDRIIKSPDSEVKYDYEVQVDPATGKQKVIESFTTTKKECAMCGGYFAQVFKCDICGAQVCLKDSRYHGWLPPDRPMPNWPGGGTHLCINCYRQNHPEEFRREGQ